MFEVFRDDHVPQCEVFEEQQDPFNSASNLDDTERDESLF